MLSTCGQRLTAGIEAKDRAGRRARAHRVNEQHGVAPEPELEQLTRIAQLAHLGSAAGHSGPYATGDHEARAVVAAERVADAGDEHARPGSVTHARP